MEHPPPPPPALPPRPPKEQLHRPGSAPHTRPSDWSAAVPSPRTSTGTSTYRTQVPSRPAPSTQSPVPGRRPSLSKLGRKKRERLRTTTLLAPPKPQRSRQTTNPPPLKPPIPPPQTTTTTTTAGQIPHEKATSPITALDIWAAHEGNILPNRKTKKLLRNSESPPVPIPSSCQPVGPSPL